MRLVIAAVALWAGNSLADMPDADPCIEARKSTIEASKIQIKVLDPKTPEQAHSNARTGAEAVAYWSRVAFAWRACYQAMDAKRTK